MATDIQTSKLRETLADYPQIGSELAGRIVEELNVNSKEELFKVAKSGKLSDVSGIGSKLESKVNEYLKHDSSISETESSGDLWSRLLPKLRCPNCGNTEFLELESDSIECNHCHSSFSTQNNILNFVKSNKKSSDIIQKIMDSSLYARWYEDVFRPNLTRIISPRPMQQEYALSTRLLNINKDSQVLDVACGTGNYTRFFAKHLQALNPRSKGMIVGLDLSMSMLKNASHRIKNEAISDIVPFMRADALNLPLEQNSFTHVHSAGSVHLMNPVEEPFKNFARVLKPGGTLVVGTFLLGEGVITPFLKRISESFVQFHWFSTSELIRILNSTGFELIEKNQAGDAITLKARLIG